MLERMRCQNQKRTQTQRQQLAREPTHMREASVAEVQKSPPAPPLLCRH